MSASEHQQLNIASESAMLLATVTFLADEFKERAVDIRTFHFQPL